MSVGKRRSTYPAEAAFHLGRGSMHRNLTTYHPKVRLIYRAPCHEGGASRPPAAFTMAKAAIPNGFGNGEANPPAVTFASIFSLNHNCALLAPNNWVIDANLRCYSRDPPNRLPEYCFMQRASLPPTVAPLRKRGHPSAPCQRTALPIRPNVLPSPLPLACGLPLRAQSWCANQWGRLPDLRRRPMHRYTKRSPGRP